MTLAKTATKSLSGADGHATGARPSRNRMRIGFRRPRPGPGRRRGHRAPVPRHPRCFCGKPYGRGHRHPEQPPHHADLVDELMAIEQPDHGARGEQRERQPGVRQVQPPQQAGGCAGQQGSEQRQADNARLVKIDKYRLCGCRKVKSAAATFASTDNPLPNHRAFATVSAKTACQMAGRKLQPRGNSHSRVPSYQTSAATKAASTANDRTPKRKKRRGVSTRATNSTPAPTSSASQPVRAPASTTAAALAAALATSKPTNTGLWPDRPAPDLCKPSKANRKHTVNACPAISSLPSWPGRAVAPFREVAPERGDGEHRGRATAQREPATDPPLRFAPSNTVRESRDKARQHQGANAQACRGRRFTASAQSSESNR